MMIFLFRVQTNTGEKFIKFCDFDEKIINNSTLNSIQTTIKHSETRYQIAGKIVFCNYMHYKTLNALRNGSCPARQL